MADVEIYYGLHGGAPLLIGAGSFEDLDRIADEAEVIDAQATALPATTKHSPGTLHFYRELGRTGHVLPLTEAAMEHYDAHVGQSRQQFLDNLRAPVEDALDEEQ